MSNVKGSENPRLKLMDLSNQVTASKFIYLKD